MLKPRTSIIVLCIAAVVAVALIPGLSIAWAAVLISIGIAAPDLLVRPGAPRDGRHVLSAALRAAIPLRAPPAFFA